ncbi:MAG: ribonuclease III [Bacteroidota bacterium]
MLFRSYYRLLFSPDKDFLRSLRNLLGFYPGNLSVYHLAFSHRSLALEVEQGIKLSNERLEYLGDAVLGSVVAEMLFKKFPYKDEGFLTEMRAKIVSRENLKQVAMKIGINEFLKKDAGPGSYRSMYGDAFEALIGAIYVDKGYTRARRFLLDRIIRNHIDLHEMEITENNFKSRILNWGQREKHSVNFEVIEEDNKSKLIKIRLLVDEKEVATGTDFVKKKAEQIAAEMACKSLGIV